MRRTLDPTARRRGMILMVVLSLLALFAIVGLTAVLYSQNSVRSSNNFAKAWILPYSTTATGVSPGTGGGGDASGGYVPPDITPLDLYRFGMGQLIYDVLDDVNGTQSAIRGWSLARTMYGFSDVALNTQPFNGAGRLNYTYNSATNPSDPAVFNGQNDRNLINYRYFTGFPLRDPERLGMRANPSAAVGAFVGGSNPPVTYPDLDNLALAASRANGTNLMPSLHRPWLFGTMQPSNPNWTNAQGRFLTLRPRPADNQATFPFPADDGGDVKNKVGYPGGNDSIWIDLGFPRKQLADGRWYKPLFAFRVEDLDSKVNLNTAGNIMGGLPGNETHVSNQGHGKWEQNLTRILNRNDSPQALTEWRNLFLGNPSVPNMPGRYGADKTPFNAVSSAAAIKAPRFFAPIDLNASDETNNFGPTGLVQLLPAAQFPQFPAGYGNGAAAARLKHAMLFDVFRPRGFGNAADDNLFPISDIKRLYYDSFTGSGAYNASVTRLAPLNFANDQAGLKRRLLATVLSMDMGRLGTAPWLYDQGTQGQTGYAPQANPEAAPAGPSVASSLADGAGNPRLRRAVEAALEAVDLDQPLPSYPHQINGGAAIGGYHGRFDDPTQIPFYQAAESARQNMASQIFTRLLTVTGVPIPVDPVNPKPAELVSIRWMAQLAVNIVDFIDEDEISTPFNYYPVAFQYYVGRAPNAAEQATLATQAISDTNAPNGPDSAPRFWVFGTEIPAVLLNEVLTEFALPLNPLSVIVAGPFTVNIWAELFNPFPAAIPGSVQQQDNLVVPLHIPAGKVGVAYSSYQIVVANVNQAPSIPGDPLRSPASFDNVAGIPDQVRCTANFAPAACPTVADIEAAKGATSAAMAVGPQQANSFFLAGPNGNTRGKTIVSTRVPGNLPWYQTNGMSYTVNYNAATGDWTVGGVGKVNDSAGIVVMLRRLANPHMPPQEVPTLPLYNPYVTVDYVLSGKLNDVTLPTGASISQGKKQPYAAAAAQVGAQTYAADPLNQHTFGQVNSNAGARDWLAHLDRQLISPFELLNVSGWRPHQLTQKFVTGGVAQSHRTPWFDEDLPANQSHRLYRLFAFLFNPDRAAGVSAYGRIPGKININTIFDYEVFAALCDARLAADPSRSNSFTEDDVIAAWRALIAYRNPGLVQTPAAPAPAMPDITGGTLGQTDRPIQDLGAGFLPAGDPFAPNGRGLADTIFQLQTGGTPGQRLFQSGQAHPYLKNELLTKIANGITTRSNTFSVWLTVGFFEVDAATGTLLGAEIGKDIGQEIRYRFFSVVDRTQLVIAPQLTTASTLPPGAGIPPPPITGVPQQVTVKAPLAGSITYASNTTLPVGWQIAVGSLLVIDRGTPSEETVLVTAVDTTNSTFTATFRREHSATMSVTMHGNPGPQPNWDPDNPNEKPVVPYWELLGN